MSRDFTLEDLRELSEELRADEEAALQRGAEKGDWCPTCGHSESEHSEEHLARCLETYYGNVLLLSRALERSLAERNQ